MASAALSHRIAADRCNDTKIAARPLWTHPRHPQNPNPTRNRWAARKRCLWCDRLKAHMTEYYNRNSEEEDVHDRAQKTYRGIEDMWAKSELDRSVDVDPNAGHGLRLSRGVWEWMASSDEKGKDKEDQGYANSDNDKTLLRLKGILTFRNDSAKKELFIAELKASCKILSSLSDVSSLRGLAKVYPNHSGGAFKPRGDGYWEAYILPAKQMTSIEVLVEVQSLDPKITLSSVDSLLLRVDYVCYGPHGRTPECQHVVLPIKFPQLLQNPEETAAVVPIPTHLLCHLDDPILVTERYAVPLARPGTDVIAIAETPLAIMEGRYRHPETVRPSWIARLVCLAFHPTSSLATACGMQSLIDISGPLRIVFAAVVGTIFKILFRIKGMFYRLAGAQAKLIDDVTGTLPPYDQFITLGPYRPDLIVEAIRQKTGISTAVVDVNDLKRVTILAASRGVDRELLTQALTPNPAGNADQRTPFVIVRGAGSAA